MQSSSCGEDQDYDSRNESISPLFNSSFAISKNPYPPPPPQPQPQPTLFDPQLQSHNLHPFSHSPAANQLDLVWSRSEPNYSTLGNLTPLSPSSSSFPPPNQSHLALSQGPNQGPLQSLDGNSPRVALNSVSDHQNQTTNAGKSSRKRTRASRRAPTTVLTTDASNFRQMVQEFTGIPAPPFSASPYARRLDLFGIGGSGGSTLRSGHLDALGPLYPFRPSAQKVQQNPLVSSTSSSSSPSMMLNNNMASTSNNNDANTFSSHYQMNMPNPILTSTFQSLLQSNGSHLGTKSQGSLGIASMDHELGMGQQHVNATSLSEFSMQVGGSTNNNLTRSIWRGEEGANGDQDQHLGSFNGTNGSPQNGTGIYKMSGSDFHSEKRMENISSRNEGTVDSWICPSD
ncbi:hypothetical protein RHMOL_Rhmol06G0104400 [Rhododendron molle]|uniref:Uncharacterized protein n=1 Tax=Rhododendron molle TaxID=49168 RepID=A0ACC0NC01_RHOML|nr:hypothetical protein RHMOL_Rhmol06G0104400 [Rhododendron molle]